MSSHPKPAAGPDAEAVDDGGAKAEHYHKINNHSGHAEEHEEGEPWLLSYADMVTLLMCFFILFFNMDKSKGAISDPERIKNRLQSLIGLDASTMATPSPASASKATSQSAQQAQAVKKRVQEDLNKLSKEMKIVFSLATPQPGVVEITFLNTDFFDSGRETMTPMAEAMVKKIAPRLTSLTAGTLIEVEGHTDSDKVTSGRFPSNWELSAARASTVARLLQTFGVPPKQLKVAGYADQRPIVEEKDKRNFTDATAKKMNRRVVVRVVMPVEDVEAGKAPVAPVAPAKVEKGEKGEKGAKGAGKKTKP